MLSKSQYSKDIVALYMALFIKKECLLKFLKFMAQPFVTLRQEWLKNVVHISIEYLK